MLFILDRALKNIGANWPALHNNYNWFPRGLSKVGAAKRLARWQYIMSKEPEDPDSCSVTTRHLFWLQGYSENKLKDDRMIKNGGYKILNFSEFREVIKNAALEISTNSLGPIEVGKLTRHHWNALNEPIVSDLQFLQQHKR